MITKSTRPLTNRERVEMYLMKVESQYGGWCRTCAGLSEVFSRHGDQLGFLAARYEAIQAGTCTCDQKITDEMREAVALENRQPPDIPERPF